MLDKAEKELEEILAPSIWGKGDDSLEGVISKWFTEKGLTLATMEEGTSGILANMITGDAGSSEYYRGGVITCSDEAKVNWGVPAEIIKEHGAISGEVAEAMAAAARERLSADFGVSTTGVFNLGNTEGKPPGLTYIGIADAQGTRSWQQNFGRYLDEVRQRQAIAALFRIRERLIELKIV